MGRRKKKNGTFWDDPWDEQQPGQNTGAQNGQFGYQQGQQNPYGSAPSGSAGQGGTVPPGYGQAPSGQAQGGQAPGAGAAGGQQGYVPQQPGHQQWNAGSQNGYGAPQQPGQQQWNGGSQGGYGAPQQPVQQQWNAGNSPYYVQGAPAGGGGGGDNQMPPPYVYPDPNKKKKHPKWPWILLIVLVALLIALYVVTYVIPWDNNTSYDYSDSYSDSDEDSDDDEDSEEDDDSVYSDDTDSDSDEDEAECYLERAETGTGVTMEVYSSEGMEELSYEEIYAQNIESMVTIICYQSSVSGTSATGIIFSSDGYIVTNEHVIEDATECYVILNDDSYYEAKLVGMDAESDLAVLKIDAEGLTAAVFGDSDELVVGNSCVAIGNPLGEDFRGTMTTGIISALNRNVEVNGYTMTLIQTDCAINTGNSGGPLINMYGQVIGICNMKMMSTETTVEGLGFAIPSNTVKSVVNKLIADGEVEKAMLGITAYSMSESECAEYGIESGIMVVSVSESCDAYLQGIREGDIITAVDGISLSTVDELNSYKADMYPGDTITLTVLRDGVYTDYLVTLMSEDDVS